MDPHVAQQWADMGTEALVRAGHWVAALHRFGRLTALGHGTATSLNACIGGLATGGQWVAALQLGAPAMAARGATRPFSGKLENWTYAPVDETARAALRIRQLFENDRLEPL